MQKTFFALLFLLILPIVFAQSEIQIVGVEAKLEQKNLAVEIIALNKSTAEGEVKITTTYFGETDERQEIVPADSTKRFTYTIHNVKQGTVKIAIENGVRKFVEIKIPEESANNQELFVKEIGAEDYLLPPKENSTNNPATNIDPYFVAAVIAVLFVIIILVKILFRKKIEKGRFEIEKIDFRTEEEKKESKIKKIQV